MQWRGAVHILCIRIAPEADQSEDARIVSLARGVMKSQSIVVIDEAEIGTAG